MSRVVITGLGVVCALGKNVSEFRERLFAGSSAITPITGVDTSSLRFHQGAEIQDFNPAEYFDNAQRELLDRFAQFAVLPARQAIADAGITITPELAPRTAVILGTSMGGKCTEDACYHDIYFDRRSRLHPLTIPRSMTNAGASNICMDFGITGPAMAISTACSSANHAMGMAFAMVRSGQVDVAITGGSEAPFSYGVLKAWEAMRVVSTDTCRPFSKDRSGLILGEGGGVLVLEPLERARERGAHVYGEIIGFGMSSDAQHITRPCLAGPAQAMKSALADAAIEPAAVGYINAHGTGTETNDRVESQAIRSIFGSHADHVLVSSTKSMHGHALGAAGAIEGIATVLALRERMIPPTANFSSSDPECNLNLVVNKSQSAQVQCALSNSFAFGGLNAVLAFRAPASS
ncbi:MAG: beta-ketoacyl-[acyl-carrier-protein] synthase family protein [Acidobacteriaceae bacterium]|nr:beta-ketoacyl-[acyl-carrier-protein] synthase family protein [Acidobacteriaceae bacterium]